MTHRVLVAGIGNIFLSDDGFGVEVVRRLATRQLPDWVKVADFGIRGMHLAYELLDGGYETALLVDATRRGDTPGTVYLIEPDFASVESMDRGDSLMADAHGMHPGAVFSMLKSLGGIPGRVLIVGCEPAILEEQIGLSEQVEGAVDEAIALIIDVLGREDLVGVRVGEDVDHLNTRSG